MHPASTAFPCQLREQWMNHMWKQSPKLSREHHLGASASWGTVQPNGQYKWRRVSVTVNQREANLLYSTYSLTLSQPICCCGFHAHLAESKLWNSQSWMEASYFLYIMGVWRHCFPMLQNCQPHEQNWKKYWEYLLSNGVAILCRSDQQQKDKKNKWVFWLPTQNLALHRGKPSR